MTFSSTVSAGNRATFWKVRARPSRTIAGVASRSLPSKVTVPLLGWYSRLRTLNSVVLPAPLGPMRAQMRPVRR